MDGKNIILDKILDMKEEFNIIKKDYFQDEKKEKLEYYVEKIGFMESKLDVLKIAILDENARQHCVELKKDIDDFKKENSFIDYEYKLNFINTLDNLVENFSSMKNWEIAAIVDGCFVFIHLNKSNMKDLNKDKKVYLNKLGSLNDYKEEAEKMTELERTQYVRELLENLLDFSLNSYNTKNEGFDLFEKIMIINILDAAKFYLNFK